MDPAAKPDLTFVCGSDSGMLVIGQAIYSSARSAVLGLTKTMAKEWGSLKVNVNWIAFGLIETRLSKAFDEKKKIVVDASEVDMGIREKPWSSAVDFRHSRKATRSAIRQNSANPEHCSTELAR